LDFEPGEILRNGIVDIEQTLFLQLQQGDAGEGFTDRADLEDGF